MPEQYDAMEKRLNARIRDLLYERDRMQRVIEAAKAMRDAGVSIGQRVVLPATEPGSMADDTALGEFLGIFDGPLQRAFDATLAKLERSEE